MINFTKDMFRVLASPCRAHAAHISRRMDGQLTAGQRTGLWVHMRGCASCRAFARQLERLRTLAREDSAAHPLPQTMPSPIRERISASIAANDPDQPPAPGR